MQWIQFFTLYGLSLPVFFVVDLLWIGLVANNFYTQQIGHLRGDINWLAAILFYVIFLIGLTYFAIYPGWQSGSLVYAALLGGLYGFFVYAAYDLTNMATLRDWPWLMTIVDMAWGTILGAIVTAGTVWLISLLG
jgi:uncharacterized membrane protein